MLTIRGCNTLGYSAVDNMEDIGGIVAWHVFQTAAYIKNSRRMGLSDAQITTLMSQSGGSNSDACPWGCTQTKIAAGFAHANDPNWSKLPVENGLAEWHINTVKGFIENQRRVGKTDKQITALMRSARSGTSPSSGVVKVDGEEIQACPAGCDESKIAEAFRQIDLGHGWNSTPPGTYVADKDGFRLTSRAAVSSGSGSSPATTTPFWSKYKWPIIIVSSLAVLGGATVYVRRRR